MNVLDTKGKFSLVNIDNNKDLNLIKDECFFDENVVASNLLNYVNKKLKSKTVIIEKDYICKDFRDEYAALYSKTFQVYSDRCLRIHFFKSKFSKINDILNISDSEYLGFSVIRPIHVQEVGKTIIRGWKDDHIKNHFYPLCEGDYKAHIMGREFTFQGMPFIQQDSMVMVCAHSAIWMSSRYMSAINRTSIALPSQISLYASQVSSSSSRHLPSESLNDEQIISVFQKMGFSPYYERKNPKSSINEFKVIADSYPYLESKLPVILGVDDHVVTIVGHTFDPKPKIVEEYVKYKKETNNLTPLSSDLWINGLLIHDDATGPYRLLPRNDKNKNNLSKNDNYKDLIHPQYTFRSVDSVLVPLPRSVFVLHEHVKHTTDAHLQVTIKDHLSKFPKSEIRNCLNLDKNNPLVTRFYLTSSTSYKHAMRKQTLFDSDLSKELVEAYECLDMPQYIWICEITTREYLSNEKEKDRLILGEILIDAKAHKYNSNPFIATHLPGSLLTMDHFGAKVPAIKLSDDAPYRHPSRQQLLDIPSNFTDPAVVQTVTQQ